MPDLVGLNQVSTTTGLRVTKSTEASIAELVQRWGVEDDTTSYLGVLNQTTTGSRFAPRLYSFNLIADALTAGFNLWSVIASTQDSGSVPVTLINQSLSNFTAIATRPVLDIQNNSTSALKINADYTVSIKSLLKFATTGLTAERTYTFPDVTDTVMTQGAIQNVTAAKRFASTAATFWNPGFTFLYSILTNAITASRNIVLPLLTANDTFVFEAHTQSLTNKTIAGASNTLTETSANIFTKGTTPNRLYPAGIIPGSPTALITSTTGASANVLYAMPFIVPTATTFDQISIEVTTAGAGSICRLGIYADNGGYPGALIFDSGNVGTTTTGLKTATITAGVQAFKPDLYWLAYENSATVPQIRCLPGTDGLSIIGYSSPPSTTLPGLCYTVAHTVGALPNPYTAGATIRTTVSTVGSPIPAIMLRAI